MNLQEKMTAALKEAMRSKDEAAVSSLRLALTALKMREKELRRALNDQETTAVISSQIKQRREAIEQYRSGGREDLAEAEESELQVLERFMPEQLSEEKLSQAVDEIIAEVGAMDMKDMGRVMKAAMARLAGQADGRRINTMVKEKLSP